VYKRQSPVWVCRKGRGGVLPGVTYLQFLHFICHISQAPKPIPTAKQTKYIIVITPYHSFKPNLVINKIATTTIPQNQTCLIALLLSGAKHRVHQYKIHNSSVVLHLLSRNGQLRLNLPIRLRIPQLPQ